MTQNYLDIQYSNSKFKFVPVSPDTHKSSALGWPGYSFSFRGPLPSCQFMQNVIRKNARQQKINEVRHSKRKLITDISRIFSAD